MTAGVAVVGAGQAGAEFVRVLRQEGFGDPIHLIGREKFAPYDRPPLSKKFLQEELAPEQLLLRGGDAYRSSAVALITEANVESIDPRTRTLRLSDGNVLGFDTCVLATGADARRPGIPGATLPGVHVLRTLEDAQELRVALKTVRRLVIVGGGYLGLEVASSARGLGVAVTVIETAPGVMQRSISALTAAMIEARHRAAGTDLRLSTSVRSIGGDTRVMSITTSDGDVVAADAVLLAIGAEPAVALARLCGLECDNGIVVDSRCRTSARNIYAIGDCANQLHSAYGRHLRLEAISSALFHARSAAADLLGKPLPPPRPPSFWSEQCGFILQVLGVPAPGAPCEDVWRGDESAFAVYRFQDHVLVAVEAVNRPKDFVRAHALIGKRDAAIPAD